MKQNTPEAKYNTMNYDYIPRDRVYDVGKPLTYIEKGTKIITNIVDASRINSNIELSSPAKEREGLFIALPKDDFLLKIIFIPHAFVFQGYVGVKKNHQYYGVQYSELPKINLKRAISFSGNYVDFDDYWFFGFSTISEKDLVPTQALSYNYTQLFKTETCWSFVDVFKETEKLYRALKKRTPKLMVSKNQIDNLRGDV